MKFPCVGNEDLIVKSSKSSWENDRMRDDCSICSTLTADAPAVKKSVLLSTTVAQQGGEPSAPALSIRPSSLVRFDESGTQYYENLVLSQEECEDLWYSNDDYTRFKKSVIKAVKSLSKHESVNPAAQGNISQLLENAYVTCFQCDQETGHNLLEKHVHAALKNQYRHNEEFILGLERIIVRRITKDRHELRACLLEIIRELQTNKHVWSGDTQLLAENIAQVSREATRSSRLFARHLGSSQVPYLLTQRPSTL